MSTIRKSLRARKSGGDFPTNHTTKTEGMKSSKKNYLDEYSYPRTGRRGAPQVFPRKLFQILNEVDEDVISWTNNTGSSFIIHDMDYFSEHVLLNYFRHQKYSSFQRQLNLYGFHKISKGPETGAYAHDCFLRDKPEMLNGVRRLPQRGATSQQSPKPSPAKLVPSKSNNKIILTRPKSPSQSTFSRLTSCLQKPRSLIRHESSSDESLGSENEDSDCENESQPIVLKSIAENNTSEDSSETQDTSPFSFLGDFEDQDEADYGLEILEQDGIVRMQPLPLIPSSSGVVDCVSEAVDQMALDHQSPRIDFRKAIKIPDSALVWSVKKVPSSKQSSPQGLHKMIPVLGRAGSSAFAIGTEVKSSEDEIKEFLFSFDTKEDSKEEDIGIDRSKSCSIDSAREFLVSPPTVMNRLSSDNWDFSTMFNEPQQFVNGQLETIFMRQESDIIIPPKLVEMER